MLLEMIKYFKIKTQPELIYICLFIKNCLCVLQKFSILKKFY